MQHITYLSNIDGPLESRQPVLLCEHAWGVIRPMIQIRINWCIRYASLDTCPDCLRLWKLRQQPFRRG